MKESNRTIILMERELFDTAKDKGFDKKQAGLDLSISEYKLKEYYFPKENETGNIFLSFPKNIPYKYVNLQIRDKLKKFKEFSLIKHKYKLVIPLKSRETEEHGGFAYLNFTNDDLNSRALIKLLLHDSRLYNDTDDKRYYLKTNWVRDKK